MHIWDDTGFVYIVSLEIAFLLESQSEKSKCMGL